MHKLWSFPQHTLTQDLAMEELHYTQIQNRRSIFKMVHIEVTILSHQLTLNLL